MKIFVSRILLQLVIFGVLQPLTSQLNLRLSGRKAGNSYNRNDPASAWPQEGDTAAGAAGGPTTTVTSTATANAAATTLAAGGTTTTTAVAGVTTTTACANISGTYAPTQGPPVIITQTGCNGTIDNPGTNNASAYTVAGNVATITSGPGTGNVANIAGPNGSHSIVWSNGDTYKDQVTSTATAVETTTTATVAGVTATTTTAVTSTATAVGTANAAATTPAAGGTTTTATTTTTTATTTVAPTVTTTEIWKTVTTTAGATATTIAAGTQATTTATMVTSTATTVGTANTAATTLAAGGTTTTAAVAGVTTTTATAVAPTATTTGIATSAAAGATATTIVASGTQATTTATMVASASGAAATATTTGAGATATDTDNPNNLAKTYLTEDAKAGSKVLEVTSVSGFHPGQKIEIAPGTNKAEVAVVESIGSIIVQQPLQNNHSSGTEIMALPSAEAAARWYFVTTSQATVNVTTNSTPCPAMNQSAILEHMQRSAEQASIAAQTSLEAIKDMEAGKKLPSAYAKRAYESGTRAENIWESALKTSQEAKDIAGSVKRTLQKMSHVRNAVQAYADTISKATSGFPR